MSGHILTVGANILLPLQCQLLDLGADVLILDRYLSQLRIPHGVLLVQLLGPLCDVINLQLLGLDFSLESLQGI